MSAEEKSSKELRAELLAKSTLQLPRGVYTGMPKIDSPFGDGPKSEAWFREDVMIGAQWLKDHPDKKPFTSTPNLHDKDQLALDVERLAREQIELCDFIISISPGHTPRTSNQLVSHLRMIVEHGIEGYTNFLTTPRDTQVG